MEKFKVEFSGGESRNCMDACNYMIATVEDSDGDEVELYAEVALSDVYEPVDPDLDDPDFSWDEFERYPDYDEAAFDAQTFPMLRAQIVEQAAEYGVSESQLEF